MSEQIKSEPRAVLLNKSHDITAFASTDESRYVINSVHYNPTPKEGTTAYLEATDGRVMIRVPAPHFEASMLPVKGACAELPEECIIPSALLKKAIKNIPNGGTPTAMQLARLDAKNGRVTLTTTDIESEQAVSAKAIEGTFPNTEQVIPRGDVVLSVSLNPHLLGVIAAYAEKHASSQNHGVVLHFYKDSLAKSPTEVIGPIGFQITLADGSKATGVLMPMRLS